MKVEMRQMRPINLLRLLLLAILLAGASACEKKGQMPPDMTPAGIHGVNYTGNGIQDFFVDKYWGGHVSAWGANSGGTGGLIYPRVWRPGLQYNIKWERSDGVEADGKTYKYRVLEKVVPMPRYTELGEFYVLFLPNDEVKIYISKGGVDWPDFPGKPGYPVDPREPKKEKP